MNSPKPKFVIALDKIPPLPGVVLELLRSLDDGNANFNLLARKIGQDPALSARALRVVNSPFYGLSGRIDNLSEAVMVLGFSAIRNLTLAASMTARFSLKPVAGMEPLRIWEHSFTCALAAQRLALLTGLSPDTAFTAGLLHDIGIMAILVQVPEHYLGLVNACPDCAARAVVEQELFGAGHDELGARLLAAWRLPPAIVEAVRWHHEPAQVDIRLVDLVHVADLVAHERAGIGLPLARGEVTEAALGRLGLDWRACGEALGSIGEQVEELVRLLRETS
jgi:putative nucleotidyltransferase with HDIG domain